MRPVTSKMMTEALTSTYHSNKPKKPTSPGPSRKRPIIKNPSFSTVERLNERSSNFKRGSSFVVGQKLRESKWFTHEEKTVLCAVIESGFIVETRESLKEEGGVFGVALWALGQEKSKNPDHLSIYTLEQVKNKTRVVEVPLHQFWPEDSLIRINNKTDKTETPLTEIETRNQILYAKTAKMKWHNTEHFAYYCRYGPPEFNLRGKRIVDLLKGTFLMRFKSQ